MDVSLREVTAENVHAVLGLAVTPEQTGYVSTNAKSIAEAHFEPRAWFRAIAVEDDLVGFLMVYRVPERPEFHIWRFMIDARYQRKGYGRHALDLLLDEARSDGAAAVTLCVRPGEHSAFDFWAGAGFEDTGELDGDQIVMRLRLTEGR